MRKNILYSILLFCCLLHPIKSAAQHIEDNPLRLDSLLKAHQNMHFYQSPTLGSVDSIWHKSERVYLYFDTDSICRQFVRKGGYNAIPDEMDYLYYALFTEMTPQRRALEIEKMKRVANEFHSQALMHEVELQEALIFPYETDELFENKWKKLLALQSKAKKRNDTLILLRVKENIFNYLFYNNHVLEAFEEAVNIVAMLDNITDRQFAGRNNLYFLISELFYLYGYYEQAIPLLEKLLKDANHFFERANLRARNTLGLYYRNRGEFDISDQYFRSILESPDQVKYRGEYDAIAICNLGKNYLSRKEYNKALVLLQKGLPVMVNFDTIFATGVYLSLGECYLATGAWFMTKVMIDSAHKYIVIQPYWAPPNVAYYPLLSKYYAATGKAKESMIYIDSSISQYNNYRDNYNVSRIFQVEKKVYDAEKKIKEEQLATEKAKTEKYYNLLISSLILLLSFAIFYLLYARLHQRKIRVLYQQIKEQDRLSEELKQVTFRYQELLLSTLPKDRDTDSDRDSLPYREIQQRQLFYRFHQYLLDKHHFTKIDIDREDLVTALATNRTTLSEAVKAITGKTLMEYIHTLRLEKARKMLDTKTELTIEAIAAECGLAYRTFYRLFKDCYHVSPAEYRKSAAL